ncbi:CotO family spore coat protein [Virgibacillus sp. CBA3643]|uniref:CotO family spore coat protein n=1 Tax=Virgibacillus sp. CBA3643 TaxID=2942278 RepID=UPI0035A273FE
MGKKKFAKDPLLYIHQPSAQTPKAPMQHNYTSPQRRRNKEMEANVSTSPTQHVAKKPLNRSFYKEEALYSDEMGSETETDESEENKDDEERMNEEKNEERMDKEKTEKKFKDMTLEEKVAYFVDAPEYAPKLRCEVKTEKRAYRGIITDSKDDKVFIQVGKRASSTAVPMEEIMSIRLLGF